VMECLDGTVIATGTLTQTEMGTWRSIPPTGKQVSIACCEIIGFDAEGRVISEEAYQDDLSIMKQLGVFDLTGTTSQHAAGLEFDPGSSDPKSSGSRPKRLVVRGPAHGSC